MPSGVGTALVVGGALGAGGAAIASRGPKAPPPRDLGQETADTLATQISMAPDVFAAESSQQFGQPAYARLQAGILEEQAPRVLGLFEDQINPALRRMGAEDQSAQRSADIGDLERLGPQVTEAWRKANPQQAELLDEMNRQSMEQLRRGGELDPSQERQAQQSARAAWSDRGRVRSSPAASAEILNRYGLQQQRQQQAMQQAGQMAGIQAGAVTDPAMAILGRPSQVAGQAQQQFGNMHTTTQAGAFNPFDPYAADLYNTNFNAKAGANIAQGNRNAAMGGGMMGMAGSIFGGMM